MYMYIYIYSSTVPPVRKWHRLLSRDAVHMPHELALAARLRTYKICLYTYIRESLKEIEDSRLGVCVYKNRMTDKKAKRIANKHRACGMSRYTCTHIYTPQ